MFVMWCGVNGLPGLRYQIFAPCRPNDGGKPGVKGMFSSPQGNSVVIDHEERGGESRDPLMMTGMEFHVYGALLVRTNQGHERDTFSCFPPAFLGRSITWPADPHIEGALPQWSGPAWSSTGDDTTPTHSEQTARQAD